MTWPQRAVSIAMALVFALMAAPAYRGYFSGDDLENLSWTSVSSADVFALGLVDPRLSPNNFRPVGHFYFWAMWRLAGLEYAAYVAVLQALHVVVAVALVLLMRRLGFGTTAAAAASAFFVLHASLLDAIWKPMYIFDVSCAMFALGAWLAWLGRRWVVAFALFWLAMKSKEIAIGLPIVIAMFTPWAERRRLWTLVPMLAVSTSFGLQALLADRPPSEYSLQFTPGAIWQCLSFYAPRVALVWPIGVALAAAILFARDSRGLFGLLAAIALAGPILVLPGRLYSPYLYLPMAGVAIGVAVCAERWSWRYWSPGIMVFLVTGYFTWRDARRPHILESIERRAYVAEMRRVIGEHPELTKVRLEGIPDHLHSWGGEGTVKLVSGWRVEPTPEANTRLIWDPARHRLEVRP